MSGPGRLSVREMPASAVGIRVDYFHDATDEYLTMLGVDRARLPERARWRRESELDCARPLAQRSMYAVLWELDDAPVGFSTADRIVLGEEAFLHLHLLEASRRAQGLGTAFVRLTVDHYLEVLGLQRIYSEPNALNTAPNRTLQRAGFRYLFSRECTPGPINFFQTVTRWVYERPRS
jgi:RimJ/RimL family protein N-acetyltransferase